MVATTSCPSCGAPLSFRPGTMVAVCRSCRSLSARTDRDPALVGKVADLVDTGSPLVVGLEGRYQNHAFALVGRVQMQHPLGGVWDEWYLAFDQGRWGWLAEAQGKLYLTFEAPLETPPPAYGELAAGAVVNLGQDGQWVVAERSEGTFLSAEGEIPWKVEPGKSYQFADLSGAQGDFATLDYSDTPPLYFHGREVGLEDLGFRAGAKAGRRVKVQVLNCPHCASPLNLRAPDQSLRVVCPSCHSLLDCAEGKLSYLQSLHQSSEGIAIPLGAEGVLNGIGYTCIGALRRYCLVEETAYPWMEYLLMDARGHFRWLTESEGHWSFVEPVAAGDVRELGGVNGGAAWKGRTFRRFQDVVAKVDSVFGEFYWKVSQGEQAFAAEFVDAPLSLSQEVQQHHGGGSEVNWSIGTYLRPEEVWSAFKLEGEPPVPRGIAPHMPNPHKAVMARMTPILVVALGLLLGMVMLASTLNRENLLFAGSFELPQPKPPVPKAPAEAPKPQGQAPKSAAEAPKPPTEAPEPADPVFFAGPFEIKNGHQNIDFELRSPVDNAWLGVEGALVSEQTGEVELFEATSSYFHGVDDGESWSEGSPTEHVRLSALPPGTYMLRLAPAWEGPKPPVPGFAVELRGGVLHWGYAWITFVVVLFWPLIQWIRTLAFEGRRWSESMYGQSGAGGGGD